MMAERRAKKDLSKVFIFSGLTDSDRKELTRKVVHLGAKHLDLKDFKSYCTHIIASKLTKSEKVLGGMATGKWILHPDYVHDSYTAGNWLDEEQYEFCDERIRKNYPTAEIELSFAPRRWRFELGEQSYAFTGWKVAVLAGAKKAMVIKRLLISGGADVYKLNFPIKCPQKIADTIAYVFVSEQNVGLVSALLEYGVLCLKPEYIGEYLIKYPPPDVTEYLATNNLDVTVPQETSTADSFLALTQTSTVLSQTSTPDFKTGQQGDRHSGEKRIIDVDKGPSELLLQDPVFSKYIDFSSILSAPSTPLLKQPVIQNVKYSPPNTPFSSIILKEDNPSVVKTQQDVRNDKSEIGSDCDSGTTTSKDPCKFEENDTTPNKVHVKVNEKCLGASELVSAAEEDSLMQMDHKQRCDQVFSEEETSIVIDANQPAKVSPSSSTGEQMQRKCLGKKLNISSIKRATTSPKQVMSPITNFFKPIFTPKVEKDCNLNEEVAKALATSTPVPKAKEGSSTKQAEERVTLEERIKIRARRRRTAKLQNCQSNLNTASSSKTPASGKFMKSNITDLATGPIPSNANLLPCGDLLGQEKEHGMTTKRTSSYLAEIQADLKRQKITACEWRPVAFAYNQRECEETEDSLRLPVTTTEIIHSMLEEGFHFSALNELYNRVSFRCLPATRTLHSLLFQVLQNSENQIEANCAYEVFMKVLRLHPPITNSLQKYYLDVLVPDMDGENIIGAEWNAILEMIYSIMDETDIQKKTNSRLMLSITRYMIQQNFQHVIVEDNAVKGTKHMLMKIIWCPSYHVVFNSRCRQLFDAMMQAIRLYRVEKDRQRKQCLLELLEDIMWLIAIVTETCRLSECGCTVSGIKCLMAEKTAVFILEISNRLIEADITDLSLLRSLLSMLQMPWLCVGICQQLLNTLDDCLLTDELSLDTKPVTLRHIVRRYLFLLPRFHQDHRNGKCPVSDILRKKKTGVMEAVCQSNNKENEVENKKLLKKAHKRNPKGETPLHRACIKNDLASLRELLKIPGVDVNIKDHFGWAPLHEACYHGSMDCVQELLKFVPHRTVELYMNEGTKRSRKVDLLAGNVEGITPLHKAVAQNRLEICRVLLQHGGEKLLEAKTCLGHTAVDFALEYAGEDIYQLLSSISKSPKHSENDSQDLSFMDSQESISSMEDWRAVEPSDIHYNEVLYSGGTRLYAHTKHLLQYIHLIKIVLESYIQSTNLLVIREKLRAKKMEARHATSDSVQGDSSAIATDRVNSQEVQDNKRDLQVLRRLPQYVEMFKSHLLKLCRPEHCDMVKKECLSLGPLAEFVKGN